MKVPNDRTGSLLEKVSLSRLQNEGSQRLVSLVAGVAKSIKATE